MEIRLVTESHAEEVSKLMGAVWEALEEEFDLNMFADFAYTCVTASINMLLAKESMKAEDLVAHLRTHTACLAEVMLAVEAATNGVYAAAKPKPKDEVH